MPGYLYGEGAAGRRVLDTPFLSTLIFGGFVFFLVCSPFPIVCSPFPIVCSPFPIVCYDFCTDMGNTLKKEEVEVDIPFGQAQW